MKKKSIILILGILFLTTACAKDNNYLDNQNNNLDNVKNSYLNDCPEYSVNELINNYITNPEWNIERNTYIVRGKTVNDDVLVIQFGMTKDKVIVKNIKINETIQDQNEYQKLIFDMCDVSLKKQKINEKNEWLKEQDEKIKNIPEGYALYTYNTNLTGSYGNSIFPGDYVDIYTKTNINPIIKKVEVLQVLDKNNNHVFESDVTETRETAKLILLVKEEYVEQLNSLKEYIYVVPHLAN